MGIGTDRWKIWEGIVYVTKTDGTLIKTVYRVDGLNFRSKTALEGYLESFGYNPDEVAVYINLISENVLTAQLAQFKEEGIEI